MMKVDIGSDLTTHAFQRTRIALVVHKRRDAYGRQALATRIISARWVSVLAIIRRNTVTNILTTRPVLTCRQVLV